MMVRTKNTTELDKIIAKVNEGYPVEGVNVGGGIHAPATISKTDVYSRVVTDKDGFCVCELPTDLDATQVNLVAAIDVPKVATEELPVGIVKDVIQK